MIHEVHMNQLSIRGFDKELERRLREVARERDISLNKAAILLLRKGAGLDDPNRRTNQVGDSLDGFIGSWTAEDEAELLRDLGIFERIDKAIWL
jgi:hypothetical protein